MEYLGMIKAFTIMSAIGISGAQALIYANKKTRSDQLASAKFGDKKDLKKVLGNGIQLSKDIGISQKYSFEGVCIFGPTGAGKTSSIYIPNLLSESLEGSIVVLDPKGELYHKTSHFQRTVCKRKVIRFAPLDPKISSRYNLLENCKDTTEVLQLAQTLLNNGALSIELSTGRKSGSGAEWITMAEPLFASSLLFVKGLGKPFNTIEYALQLLIKLSTNELFYLFEYCNNEDAKMQFDIFKTVLDANNTVSGIKITLASNTKLFVDPKINEVSSYSDFSFKDFRKEKTIVYITYPEHEAVYISPFMASFFTQMLNTLIEEYKPGRENITIFFDEFANIGRVSNMVGYASTVRSRNISLNICLQSITQLEMIYGKDEASAIINNLKTKVILPGLSDFPTMTYVNKLSGIQEVDMVTMNTDKDNNHSYTSTVGMRDLIWPDEVRRLRDNEVLIITNNKNPIMQQQNVYFLNREYLDKVRETEDIQLRTHYYSNTTKKEFLFYLKKVVELNKVKHSKDKNNELEESFMLLDKKRFTKKSLADEIFGD